MTACGCIGKIEDLAWLSLSPDRSLNTDSISSNGGSPVLISRKNTSTSSAYRDAAWVWQPTLMPCDVPRTRSLQANGSIASAKSSGDRGHPCLVPLLIVHVSEKVRPIFVRAIGFLYNILIQDIIVVPNPMYSST